LSITRPLLPYTILFVGLFMAVAGKAQKANADSLRIAELLSRADVLTQHARYDSAIAVAKEALHISATAKSKTGEAASYDRLSEVMLATGKWTDLHTE